MGDASNSSTTCSRCGKALPPDIHDGLCPACLLAAGSQTLTQSVQEAPAAWGGDAPTAGDGLRLIAGQLWGPYRIGRLLGRGGMGEVYEAEHTVTGRRLALKVLRSRLQNAEERERFLREGRLAASISHPHTVYIFGSEEISGIPVISMELSPRGTLKDRVAASGPMAPAEAVSAVLDILGGLDAAQAAGILHRDIKPSNCFLDDEGNVKVGDFGLSISTLARDVQTDVSISGFQGTPQFAAPEQLRGEPLDLRADIYAVGATLFYLLTGRPPFETSDLKELVDKAATEPPQSPRLLRREIPSGLASVVLRCLAKTPEERPSSYAALATALRPYSSRGNVPARLGVRLLAGVVDTVVLGLSMVLAALAVGLSPAQSAELQVLGWIPAFAYFLSEGLWATTPGKRLFGLRIASVEGGVASWSRILRRHLLFDLPALLLMIPIAVVGFLRSNVYLTGNPGIATAISLVSAVFLGLLFLTARRHNGWAAIHDLVSGTRVVMSANLEEPRLRPTSEIGRLSAETASGTGLRFGPFIAVTDQAASHADSVLHIGFDPVLRRHVWIRTLPPGTPMISAERRDASRTGRLHWLSGRRSENENWDAYEAPDGGPFLDQREPPSWSTLRLWLLDLSSELQISIQEQSLPTLALNRLWIRSDRRLVLLDFPAPGVSTESQNFAADLEPAAILRAVAAHSLSANESDPGSIPLSVRSVLKLWSSSTLPAFQEAHAALRKLPTSDRIPRWRRAIPSMLAALPFLAFGAAGLVAMSGFVSIMPPEKAEMVELLDMLTSRPVAFEPKLDDPEYRAEIEVYLAGRHADSMRDPGFWDSPAGRGVDNEISRSLGLPSYRTVAADILARHPVVTPDELARATNTIAAQLENQRNKQMSASSFVFMLAFSIGPLMLVWSLISALIVPGGLGMRLSGLALVTRDGTEARRWRSVVRAFIAWMPLVVWMELVRKANLAPGTFSWVWTWPGVALVFGPLIVGAIWAMARPHRGLTDHALRTWIVSR